MVKDLTAGLVQAVVISFGYGHDPAPQADMTIDARRHFRNPHADPAMRTMTGLDAPVRAHVLATPGVPNVIKHAIRFGRDLLDDVANDRFRLVTIAVGCVGGRHRSVAMATEIGAGLRALGIGTDIEHRDIDHDILPSQTHARHGGTR
ncbi:hypothetical protein ACFQVD_44730 [Streptosporangium amethystogenes subsp. fukuiense]|uniref:RapZ C-terminal domain-containing protein n=1 Tax=Streptosporangium amethystogenes subsp. fukuiense TaxID=698418 RepID=A0ABW2TEY5_9ACTN